MSHTTRHLLVSATFFAFFACAPADAPEADASSDGVISAAELAGRIESGDAPLILDVRTPEEFADGHLPGALNIPHMELAGRLDQLPAGREDEIVVHCKSGRRAMAAEATLRDAGYTNVRDLEGHWLAWQQAGLPAE